MSAINRLYNSRNTTVKKSINIDDTLYNELIKITNKNFSASISEVINVAIEEYVEKNNFKYYPKPEMESVTYRSIMIRKDNLKNLKNINKSTGITFTRLLNAAIKDFINIYK